MPIIVEYHNNVDKKFNSFEEIKNYEDVIELNCSFMNLQELPRPSLTHFIRYELNQRLSYKAL
jgi:hypothetical protein